MNIMPYHYIINESKHTLHGDKGDKHEKTFVEVPPQIRKHFKHCCKSILMFIHGIMLLFPFYSLHLKVTTANI